MKKEKPKVVRSKLTGLPLVERKPARVHLRAKRAVCGAVHSLGLVCALPAGHKGMHLPGDFIEIPPGAVVAPAAPAAQASTEEGGRGRQGATLVARLLTATALLNSLEWVVDGIDDMVCPMCLAKKRTGHAEACRLGAFLNPSAAG